MISGVKNCTPRARLKAVPIAVFRTLVGKISEKIGPYPEKFPVPKPTMNMNARASQGHAAIRLQNKVMATSPTAQMRENPVYAGLPPFHAGKTPNAREPGGPPARATRIH